MAVRGASEIRVWRDTPVGACVFLAQEIAAHLDEITTDARKEHVPTNKGVELVLLELAGRLHSSNPATVEKVRRVLRITEQPDR